MNEALELRDFTAADYTTYQSWFSDEALNRELGPIDADWLDHILNADEGTQLAVFRADQLVGVVGILPPNDRGSSYLITDIAVRPALRGQGIGSRILDRIMAATELAEGQSWACHVRRDNKKARRFFEKNGWRKAAEEEKNMVRYVCD